MKKFLIAVLLSIGLTSAFAKIAYVATNDDGDTLVLTDEPCSVSETGGVGIKNVFNAIFSQGGVGQSVKGCWAYNSGTNTVLVVYEDKSFAEIQAEAFYKLADAE